MRKILLAVDESEFSEAAARAVIAQTRAEGVEIRVLHVAESIPAYLTREAGPRYLTDVEAFRQDRLKSAKDLVEKIARQLRSAGFNVSTAVEEGDAKSTILDAAKSWHPDLIVMGSHGRTGLNRFLLGSVSEAIARHAPCSVLIVRLPKRR
jgi:nucleotide-binding universal stress UspA family protein